MIPARGWSVFWRASKKRWVLSYADRERGRPQKLLPKEIRTEREAERWAAEWLDAQGARPAEVLHQRHADGPTLANCAERWLALQEQDERVAPATYRSRCGHLRNHILPAVVNGVKLGERPIADLDVPELRAWLRELRGRRAAQTCRNTMSTFALLYGAAMAEGWVRREANLLDHAGVRAEMPPAAEHEPVVLPLAWAQALIISPKAPLERRARYALAFTSGMRDGEISGARLHDLDLAAEVPTLRIEQSVAIIGTKTGVAYAKPKAPKTRKSRRTLPLHPAAVDALRAWLASPERAALLGRLARLEDYIFPGPGGVGARPRSADHIRSDLRALRLPTELDGRPVEFKDTRSSFASWLEENEVSEAIRKRLMGHVPKDVTEKHYTKRGLERLAEAVESIALIWQEVEQHGDHQQGAAERGSGGDVHAPGSRPVHGPSQRQDHLPVQALRGAEPGGAVRAVGARSEGPPGGRCLRGTRPIVVT